MLSHVQAQIYVYRVELFVNCKHTFCDILEYLLSPLFHLQFGC